MFPAVHRPFLSHSPLKTTQFFATAIRKSTKATSPNLGTTGESIYQFHALDIDGNDVSFDKYK
jgi:hypothetical protein